MMNKNSLRVRKAVGTSTDFLLSVNFYLENYFNYPFNTYEKDGDVKHV